MAVTKFKDYMSFLLPAPLKKVFSSKNDWNALMQVIGELFDSTKSELMWGREQTMIRTCSPELLGQHGLERDMPRLKGEDMEAYRLRLTMKAIIAKRAGTNEGIKIAVKALGYDNSYVEPYYEIDPDRWAEFIVWLRTTSKTQISLNDFSVIDAEVMKVKPASALPNYGVEFGSNIDIESEYLYGGIMEPLCGTFYCGAYPPERSDSI